MENNQESGDPTMGREADGGAQEQLGARQKTGQRTGLRAAALRRAREAKQARDARRRQHELGVEGALADYYAAIAYIEDTRARASRRTARILSEAEESVQPVMEEADAAVRRLRDLGESRETIRELTQASLARLRAALNGDLSDSSGATRTGASAGPGGAIGEDRDVEASARISDAVGTRHDDRIEAHPVELVDSDEARAMLDGTGATTAMHGPMGEEPLDWGGSGYPAAS